MPGTPDGAAEVWRPARQDPPGPPNRFPDPHFSNPPGDVMNPCSSCANHAGGIMAPPAQG